MEMYMFLHAFILVSLVGFISWSPRRRLSAEVCFIHSIWHDGKQLCHFYCGLNNVLTGFTWCFYSHPQGSFTGSWVVAGFSQLQWSKNEWYVFRKRNQGMCYGFHVLLDKLTYTGPKQNTAKREQCIFLGVCCTCRVVGPISRTRASI